MSRSPRSAYAFDPACHEGALTAIFAELHRALAEEGETAPGREIVERRLDRILRRHPKDGRGFFSRSELVRGLRHLVRRRPEAVPRPALLRRALRKKPVRSLSGVAVVTVLTRPHPCPGRCIFCPDDVRMPKSYLSDEPGSQRAATHGFDPYRQTFARLLALHHTGHCCDKVELIVLGGTWSSYPRTYQRWFLTRCFEALTDFGTAAGQGEPELPDPETEDLDSGDVESGDVETEAREETASWSDLAAAQCANETAAVRCIGLALETRPDWVTPPEAKRLRRLGATRIQLGVQSLSDPVLAANRRGHDVAATRRAFSLLRRTGFKIVAHWMPNLLGSTPEADREDFDRLFDDPGFRPDELKIYPCSLVETAELMRFWQSGDWRPYTREELLSVLVHALPRVPATCRVTRVVRDIPGTDIVTGNRVTNFRQVVEEEIARRGIPLQEIRSREIRDHEVDAGEIRVEEIRFRASQATGDGGMCVGEEVFLRGVAGDRLVGFLRLSLPRNPGFLLEIEASAMIREVHVYGRVAGLGTRSRTEVRLTAQHRGLGGRLIERAGRLAASAGYRDLAVISSVGTREYYRRLGFRDGELYQHRTLPA